MSELLEMLREARAARGWSFGDLARALGATNVSKMGSRLARLERDEEWSAKLYRKAAAVLGLDRELVEQKIEAMKQHERDEFEEWVSVPVPPELYYSPLAGFWILLPIPAEIETEEALLEHARRLTRSSGCVKTSVALNRRITVWFAFGEETGRTEAKPGGLRVPYMTVGNSAPFVMESTK